MHSGRPVPSVQKPNAAVGPVSAALAAGAGAAGIVTADGLASTLPAASTERTASMCPAGAVSGLAQALHSPPSRRHWKPAVGSLEENVTVAAGCTAEGRIASARVSAGIVSTVHVRDGGVASRMP